MTSDFLKPILASAVLMLLGGCTAESIYESVQRNQLQRCEELPIPVQANCKSQYQQSYEEYDRERRELLDENIE